MRQLKKSTVANLMVFVTDPYDHYTGKAGLTLTGGVVTISKNGGAFGALDSSTITDRGSGWYNIALTVNDTDTVGDLCLHIAPTGGAITDMRVEVVNSPVDTLGTNIGSPVALDSGTASLAGMLTKLADDSNGSAFDATNNSLKAIRDATQTAAPSPNVATSGSISTGTPIGGTTYTNTQVENNVYWTIEHSGGDLDVYLGFTAPTVSHIPVQLKVVGYLDATSAPTAYVDIYVYNYTSSSYERVSGNTNATRFGHATTNQTYLFTINKNHINPLTGAMSARFKHGGGVLKTTNALNLDYVTFLTTITTSITAQQIATEVWNTNLEQYQTLYSAGASLYYGMGIIRATIIDVTDESHFVIDIPPPGEHAWDNHIIIVKHISNEHASCVPIVCVDLSGNVETYEPLYSMPIVGDYVMIANEVAVGKIFEDGFEDVEDACYNAISTYSPATSGEIQAGCTAALDEYGASIIDFSDVEAACTDALEAYPVPKAGDVEDACDASLSTYGAAKPGDVSTALGNYGTSTLDSDDVETAVGTALSTYGPAKPEDVHVYESEDTT